MWGKGIQMKIFFIYAFGVTIAACSASDLADRKFEKSCTQFLDCVMPGYLKVCPSESWPPPDSQSKSRYLECYKTNFQAMQLHSYKCADKLGLDRAESWNAAGKCDSLNWRRANHK